MTSNTRLSLVLLWNWCFYWSKEDITDKIHNNVTFHGFSLNTSKIVHSLVGGLSTALFPQRSQTVRSVNKVFLNTLRTHFLSMDEQCVSSILHLPLRTLCWSSVRNDASCTCCLYFEPLPVAGEDALVDHHDEKRTDSVKSRSQQLQDHRGALTGRCGSRGCSSGWRVSVAELASPSVQLCHRSRSESPVKFRRKPASPPAHAYNKAIGLSATTEVEGRETSWFIYTLWTGIFSSLSASKCFLAT